VLVSENQKQVTLFSRVVEGTAADVIVDEVLGRLLLAEVFDWIGPE